VCESVGRVKVTIVHVGTYAYAVIEKDEKVQLLSGKKALKMLNRIYNKLLKNRGLSCQYCNNRVSPVNIGTLSVDGNHVRLMLCIECTISSVKKLSQVIVSTCSNC